MADLETEAIVKAAADPDAPREEAFARLFQCFHEDAGAVRQALEALDDESILSLCYRASKHTPTLEALAAMGVDNVIKQLGDSFRVIVLSSLERVVALDRGLRRAGRDAELVTAVEEWFRRKLGEDYFERMSELDPREPNRGVYDHAQDMGRYIAAFGSKPLRRAALKAAKQAIDGLGNASTLQFYLEKGIRNPEIDPFNC